MKIPSSRRFRLEEKGDLLDLVIGSAQGLLVKDNRFTELERDELWRENDLLRNALKLATSPTRPLLLSEEQFVQILNDSRFLSLRLIDHKSAENADHIYKLIQTGSDDIKPTPECRISFIGKSSSGLWCKCRQWYNCAFENQIINRQISFSEFFSRYCLFNGGKRSKKAVNDGCRNQKRADPRLKTALMVIFSDSLTQ